jgi:hypothetical protein
MYNTNGIFNFVPAETPHYTDNLSALQYLSKMKMTLADS